ncbi:sensor domain-containing diguanylate cyclase [Alkalihalobacterium chitinilyticum]|uniref:Sensor domain-containing diguanylate cyclase n=1 Tax=Alkalihalobacterium chitinilyticum TaxID=2980103 RepID=A0ABT5VGQ1_9BACI|nr:sensor domain-containing diguanylate cyclase [Alkalihalobacterium chitinilyticum]MDE5414450.1 sensor domain-containing diguanylate cyclase [Alkalihalobacterium chitinilyticum]
MKNISKVFTIYTFVCMGLFLLVHYAFQVPNAVLLFVVLLIPMFWLCSRYNHLQKEKAKVDLDKSELEKNYHSLVKENEHLHELMNSFNETFFSYNVNENKLFITKGIESLFSHDQEDYHQNVRLIETVLKPLEESTTSFRDQLFANRKMRNQLVVTDKYNEKRWLEISTTPLFDGSETIVRVDGMISDITKRKQLEEYLRQMAYYDELTDLPNRKLIHKHLRKAMARSKRHQHSLSIMFIDLDGFKKVNDTLGHEGGDILLKEVANRLNSCVREEDLTGRLGGDEFMIVFEETSKDEIIGIAERILSVVSAPYTINENEAKVTPSIGISILPDDGEDLETLIQNADKAMYHAKEKGKGTYQFFSPELEDYHSKKVGIFEKFIESVSKIKETYIR